MKPGQDTQEAYRDLIDRAEIYFKKLVSNGCGNTPYGAETWLRDLEETRIWELIENYQGTKFLYDDPDSLDVPL